MMSVMDLIPSLRWCVDVGGGRSFVLHPGLTMERNLLREWLTWMGREADHVVVAAWFSVTDPAGLRAALAAVDPVRLAWYANTDLGRGERAADLHDLAAIAARIAAQSGTSNSRCAPRHGMGSPSGVASASTQHHGPTA